MFNTPQWLVPGMKYKSSHPSGGEGVPEIPATKKKPSGPMRQAFEQMCPELVKANRYNWKRQARKNQLPPKGDWQTWLVLAGRGFGKTRTGAEWIRGLAENNPGIRIALVSPTSREVRDVMIEGESGILSCCPDENRPLWRPAIRQLVWPNGAVAYAYSAEEPDRLRGYQHHYAWCDELSSWKRPQTWDNLMMGLRLGDNPRTIVTTTPKPMELLKRLIASDLSSVVRGSTYDNRKNLAPGFMNAIIQQYEGTTLGRQELYGELVEVTEGALWTLDTIHDNRVNPNAIPEEFSRVVVAVDPAMTNNKNSDETGIVVAAMDEQGHFYVLQDASGKMSSSRWAYRAVELYHKYQANTIVAETNQGGDLVEEMIKTVDQEVFYSGVRASRGKFTRAEPIAALYEQGLVHHVGIHKDLENQMTSYVPGKSGKSPDRMDALVWAIAELKSRSGFGKAMFRIWSA